MPCAGTYIRFAVQSANTCYYQPSTTHEIWSTLEAWENEAKTRRMFEWKEPKKHTSVSTVLIIRRYENRFTGRKFPVGGPKK